MSQAFDYFVEQLGQYTEGVRHERPLTELVYATRRDANDTRAVLERIEEALTANAALSSVSTAPAKATATATTKPYLATATGTMYHRPECPSVAGRQGLRQVDGTEAGLSPCRICQPD